MDTRNKSGYDEGGRWGMAEGGLPLSLPERRSGTTKGGVRA